MLPLAVDEPTETDVKKCVSCAKDLPDTALHCVFCGSKQPAVPAPADPAVAKTMMGYAAADLLKNLPKPGAPGAAPQAQPIQPPAMQPPQPQAYQPPQQQPFQAPPQPYPPPQAPMPDAMAKTAFAGPPGGAYSPPSSPMQPPQQQPYPPPQPMQPPMGGPAPSPAAQAATMFMDGPRPGMPGSPAPMGNPVGPHAQTAHPSSPNYPPAPQSSPYYPPAPAPQSSPHYPPAPAPYPPPASTAQVPQPPYLASRTAERMRPIDPFAGALPIVLIVFGALLIAAFVVPVSGDPVKFWWDALDRMDGKTKVMPILLAGAGLLGVLLGAIPLASTGRAAAAAACGVVAILYPAIALPPEFQWQLVATALGSLLVPTGLLLRSAYRDAALGRILATVGAILVIVPLVVPEHDQMPIQGFIDILTGNGETPTKIAAAGQLARIAIAALALIAWIPGPSEGGAKAIAWIWILLSVAIHFAVLLAAGDIGEGLEEAPNLVLIAGLEPIAIGGAHTGREGMLTAMLIPSGVVLSAYLAYASYGLATLLGKNLEH